MAKRINIPKKPANDAAYRKAYKLLAPYHHFNFRFRPKSPFDRYQKSAITRAWKKYAYLILYAQATDEWRELDKAGDPRKGKAFPQYKVTIKKITNKKVFKDVKNGLVHTNKGYIFIRDDATNFRYEKQELETLNKDGELKTSVKYTLTWMHRPVSSQRFKTPWRMYSEVIPIPTQIYDDWALFVPWLRAMRERYPKDTQFSLIFGRTNYIIKPLDFDRIEFYAANEVEELERREEETGSAKFPYTAIRAVWYERVKQ